MNPLVSIIIPVYNLENYIENCLNSISNQTFTNLEIICIDDGSTDSSANIIKKLASQDKRIKYFFQKNSGVSVARNSALKKASGEYISFIDGDDYIHPQMIELLVDCAITNNADIVCSDFSTTHSTVSEFEEIKNIHYRNCVNTKELFFQNKQCQIGETVWCKLYKKSIAKSSEFPEDLSYSEDSFYFINMLKHQPTIYMIDHPLYYYLQRSDSAVHMGFNIKRMSTVYSYNRLCKLMKNSNNSYEKSFCFKSLYRYINYNRMCSKKTPFEHQIKKECRKIGFKWLIPYLLDKHSSNINKMLNIIFFIFPPLYEFARIKTDPTMKEFLKQIREKQ